MPGSNESFDELLSACAGCTNLMRCTETVLNCRTSPFSALVEEFPITPFGSRTFDFSEADATRLLNDCAAGAVLISHSPPKGAVDQASTGKALIAWRPEMPSRDHIDACAGNRATIAELVIKI